jgi:hypothetical protein
MGSLRLVARNVTADAVPHTPKLARELNLALEFRIDAGKAFDRQ